MTTETIYTYPDGRQQRLGTDLDAVPVANATERTAPRSRAWLPTGHVAVPRTLLVGLLDAWQAVCEAEDGDGVEGPAYWDSVRVAAREALDEALADFAEGVTL